MNIALAAVGFKTSNIEYNKNKIIDILEKYSKNNDLVVFGETFLQGFNCLCWDFEKDKYLAFSKDDKIIKDIGMKAKKCKTAVSFGYVEREGDKLFSSQLTLDKDGKIADNYRRISTGWKEPVADAHYCEGESFHSFTLAGKSLSVGLCGDLWYDNNVQAMQALATDIVLWPVYVDYDFNAWNASIKLEYATRAKRFARHVLLVNSVCLEPDTFELARGGATYFHDGDISCEMPAGEEEVLEVAVEGF